MSNYPCRLKSILTPRLGSSVSLFVSETYHYLCVVRIHMYVWWVKIGTECWNLYLNWSNIGVWTTWWYCYIHNMNQSWCESGHVVTNQLSINKHKITHNSWYNSLIPLDKLEHRPFTFLSCTCNYVMKPFTIEKSTIMCGARVTFLMISPFFQLFVARNQLERTILQCYMSYFCMSCLGIFL